MKKIILLLLVSLNLFAADCDQVKVFKSDEILVSYTCENTKYQACVMKSLALSGREYIGLKLFRKKDGVKSLEMYKWLDSANTEFAMIWDTSNLTRLVNISSTDAGNISSANHWKMKQVLEIKKKNIHSGKILLKQTLNCK